MYLLKQIKLMWEEFRRTPPCSECKHHCPDDYCEVWDKMIDGRETCRKWSKG